MEIIIIIIISIISISTWLTLSDSVVRIIESQWVKQGGRGDRLEAQTKQYNSR